MKLEGTIHCDGPECENHTRVAVAAMEQGRLPHFIKVIEYGHRDVERAFCSYDCLLKWAAKFPPTETFSAPDGFFDGLEDGGA